MNKSFTLIELLIVIAIIAIIAGAVLVAINPAKRIAQANDSRRYSEVRSILSAVNTYVVDNKGDVPDCGASDLPNDNRWRVIGTAGGFDYTGSANCVGTWLMNDNTDPTADACGTNDGTLNGPPTFTSAGRDGGAYEFDGNDLSENNNYINITDNDALSFESGLQDFSVTAWIKSDAPTPDGFPPYEMLVIDKRDVSDDGWRLTRSYDDGIWLSVDDIDVKSDVLTWDGRWYFVAAVIDRGENGQIYIDGNASGIAVAISSEAMNIDTDLFIGGSHVIGFSLGWNGTIDEVAIFNTALTPDQIKEIYDYGLVDEFCDLNTDLVIDGGYLSKIPEDPTEGDLAGTGISGYLIKRSSSGTISVKAPHASQYTTQEIMVSR